MLIRIAHHLEEGFIALLLGLMTLITFSQVVARYFFGAGFGWALELTKGYCRVTDTPTLLEEIVAL